MKLPVGAAPAWPRFTSRDLRNPSRGGIPFSVRVPSNDSRIVPLLPVGDLGPVHDESPSDCPRFKLCAPRGCDGGISCGGALLLEPSPPRVKEPSIERSRYLDCIRAAM